MRHETPLRRDRSARGVADLGGLLGGIGVALGGCQEMHGSITQSDPRVAYL